MFGTPDHPWTKASVEGVYGLRAIDSLLNLEGLSSGGDEWTNLTPLAASNPGRGEAFYLLRQNNFRLDACSSYWSYSPLKKISSIPNWELSSLSLVR